MYYFILCVWLFFACMCVCTIYGPSTGRVQERVSNPLGLELQTVVNTGHLEAQPVLSTTDLPSSLTPTPTFTFSCWKSIVEFFLPVVNEPKSNPLFLTHLPVGISHLTSVKTWHFRATPYTLKFPSYLLWLVWVSQLRNYLVTGSPEDTGKAIRPPLPLGVLFSGEAASLLGTLSDSQGAGELNSFHDGSHFWTLLFTVRNGASKLPGVGEGTL